MQPHGLPDVTCGFSLVVSWKPQEGQEKPWGWGAVKGGGEEQKAGMSPREDEAWRGAREAPHDNGQREGLFPRAQGVRSGAPTGRESGGWAGTPAWPIPRTWSWHPAPDVLD